MPAARATSYGPVRDDAELSVYGSIAGDCFGIEEADVGPWLERVGRPNVRVLRDRGTIVAGLALVPMGQWFGGRSVPMTGIAAVGVPPAERGRGRAAALMRAVVAELAEAGVPLSALYPSTTALYRQSGYEVAGSRFALALQPSRIGVRDHTLSARRVTPDDEPVIVEAARRLAAAAPGHLDRGDYIWGRIRDPRKARVSGYVVEVDGQVEGWAYLEQREAQPREFPPFDLLVHDIGALTQRAGRRLLTLLADHGTMCRRVVLIGGPSHPLLMLLPERHYELELHLPWMLRLVDVPAALTARGWPVGLSGQLVLELSDDLLGGNAGRFRLEVAGGSARVRAAAAGDGAPRLALDVRGLAPLYSGHATPRQLVMAGLAEGDETAQDVAEALFAGPAPTMADMF
jgi:predicted acetyltransferase